MKNEMNFVYVERKTGYVHIERNQEVYIVEFIKMDVVMEKNKNIYK
jgi:hypothetical protein